MDSLVRKALLGNKEARIECAEKGIVLPCPFCGGNKIKRFCVCGDYFMECSSCHSISNHSISNIVNSHEQALKLWNTRPAPPIGRCGECKYFTSFFSELGHCALLSQKEDWKKKGHHVEMLKTDFCSYFEPKEEESWN